MKQKTQKTFKCEECKDILPCFRLNQIGQLVSAKKYINGKIVCGRCYYRIKEKIRLKSLKSKKKDILEIR